jgi:hypothetical protein
MKLGATLFAALLVLFAAQWPLLAHSGIVQAPANFC